MSNNIFVFLLNNFQMTFDQLYQLVSENTHNIDDEYFNAIETDNIKKIEYIINNIVDHYGYSIGPVYRGDADKNIHVFDPTKSPNRLMNKHPSAVAFFTDNERKSAQHGHTRRFFLNMKTPNTIDGSRIEQGKIGVEPGIHLTDAKIDQLIQKGHDGNIFLNAYDHSVGLHTEYVVFSPNQIKLADPITYDDNNKIIPISKRFDSTTDDIRY